MTEYTGRVAAVVIPRTEEEERFLVAKRNDSGDWEFPGGKEHENENLLETAEREIKEEFQLEIEAQEAKPEYAWKGGGYEIVPVYATHGYENLETILKKSRMTDHSQYKWITPGKLGENLENAEEKLGDELEALEAFGFP